jgi:hypothetical protein
MLRATRLALACLTAALFAGCALTPTQVRDVNLRTEVASNNPPFTAVNCIARKLDQARSGMIPKIRETGAPARYAVEVWILDNTIAVIEAAPAASGSTLTVWRHPKVLEPAVADLMAKVDGC